MSQNTTTLKVLEAYTRDVGRGVARIDYDSMDSLSASTGDVVEIKGKRKTVAKCLPLYPSDEIPFRAPFVSRSRNSVFRIFP